MSLIERIRDATLYLGDCRNFVPEGEFAVVSDPPYGQGQNTNVRGKGGVRAVTPPGCGSRAINNAAKSRVAGGTLHRTGNAVEWPEGIIGDDAPFDAAMWLTFTRRCLFWGAHRFSHRLPRPGSWLVWDKVPTGKIRDQGDGEAAWISDDNPRPLRIYRLLWDGVCVGPAARSEVTAGQQRVHPTQKPVALMKWCIQQMNLPAGITILDPYMGSGSTGVAALELGYPFVGVEIEPVYFKTSCARIEQAQKQTDLFVQRPAESKQESWNEMWVRPFGRETG